MENEIGKRLASYRKRKRMTQEELATKLNLSRSLVGQWETGKRDCEYLSEVCRILDVDEGKILNDVSTPNQTLHYELGLSDDAIEFLKTVKNNDYYVPFTDTDDDELNGTSVYHWADSDTDTNDYVGIEGAYPDEILLAINTLLSSSNGQQLIAMIAKFISIDFGQSYINNELCFDVEYNNEDAIRKKTRLPLTLMRYALLQAICSKLEEIKKDFAEGDAE